ncbi:MAG: hypothetical protein ACD_9C00246G0008 [uncultured bacterium]|nr:MAG: hypothetical protein ACD_9C00246G0008 [uncultured bacterium]
MKMSYNQKQKSFSDIIRTKSQQEMIVDIKRFLKSENFETILFSRGKRTDTFFTEDSKLYITPRQQKLMREGVVFDDKIKKWDALSSRVVNNFVRYQPSQTSLLLKSLEKRYAMLDAATIDGARSFFGQFSTVRLWNASIVGSILFGMVTMTFIYRYLGQGVEAKQLEQVAITQQINVDRGLVLGTADTKDDAESFAKQVAEIEQIRDEQSLEDEIRQMVKGYPIEEMVPYIAKKDRTVAAFIVAIAKKESAWGKRVPVLKGQDCYNLWGYRGQRQLMGTGGHTCFNSPKDAVDTVAKRITTLVEEKGKDTPEKMVLWKCGNDCEATGGKAAADKWVKDVDSVFKKFHKEDE